MKHTKFTSLTNVLLVCACALVALVSCRKPEQIDPVKLRTPEPSVQSQSHTGFVVSWPEIENASYYTVLFGDEEENVTVHAFEAEDLTPAKYTIKVKAVSDSKDYQDSDWSEPLTIEIGEEQSEKFIELVDCGRDFYTFVIRGEDRRYLFSPIEKILFDMGGFSPESYLAQFGLTGYGTVEYQWVNGETYEGYYDISVAPDREYIIFAAVCDDENNITGEIHRIDFKTEANPESDKSIYISLSEITSTSVKILAEPDAGLSEYYIYTRDKAWYDDILANYGESMLITLIKYPSANAKHYTETSLEVWEDLKPSTEYVVGAVGVEGESGAEMLVMKSFTTNEASGNAPVLEISATASTDLPHEKVDLKFKSDVAYLMRYVCMPTADIQHMYLSKGKTYDDIISSVGTDLTVEEVEMANAGGFEFQIGGLWRETEYTCIVSARSKEWLTTTKHITVSTAARPALPRVESELFELLPGKWMLSYDCVKPNGDSFRIENVEVEISAGPDAVSAAEYRSQNQLVVCGYQFQSTYATQPVPYYSPEDLMQSNAYWNDFKSLAYRDYGPKFFLQITQDGKVVVPTSENVPFYDWDVSTVYFIGADLTNKYTAPASFPVEISSDRNTVTIKECKAGPEFMNGTYRPAVFLNGVTSMLSAATSDIVLKRADS